jgi:predicted RNA binding protein YcfA (HicA-like mRNA interferase family)
MASFSNAQFEHALEKKGFVRENRDHRYFRYYYNGKKTSITTKASHCQEEINEHLIHKIQKQLHLNNEDTKRFIKCPLTKEEYLDKLIKANLIKKPIK